MTKNGAPTILILDEMSAHMTAEVRSAIASCGTFLHFIPGGYTSKLQVMDVGFNKSFKSHYRDLYDEWFMHAPDGVKPKRPDVSVWVSQSWERIANTVAPNTWRKVGLPHPGAGEQAEGEESEPVDTDASNFEGQGPLDGNDDGSVDDGSADNGSDN